VCFADVFIPPKTRTSLGFIDRFKPVEDWLGLSPLYNKRGSRPNYPRYPETRAPVDGFSDMTAPEVLARGAIWLAPKPLILASKSEDGASCWSRQAFPSRPRREIDERGLERTIIGQGGGADAVVCELARAKALLISAESPDSFVLGADQAASCEQRLFGKPADLPRRSAARLSRPANASTACAAVWRAVALLSFERFPR